MKILIDIGHPAHVHYFKNFIKIMETKGHEFCIVAKDRDVVFELLNYNEIKFYKRPNTKKGLIRKLLNVPSADYLILNIARAFKPDILLGFSGTHISHVGRLINKPSVVFDDTEHAKLAHASYKPFANSILTPSCFNKNLGVKQIRFNGYMELCYLHPKNYKPDIEIFKILGVKEDEKYVILRFVSWEANHDVGQTGLDYNSKMELVNLFSKQMKVFISSEVPLKDELRKYQIKIPANKMHDALACSSLLFGESGTMTSECAMLGTPAIRISGLPEGTLGTLHDQEKYGLIYNYEHFNEEAKKKAIEILLNVNAKEEWKLKRDKMVAEKIDVTAFMVWFMENYPVSANTMKQNPDYQYNFK